MSVVEKADTLSSFQLCCIENFDRNLNYFLLKASTTAVFGLNEEFESPYIFQWSNSNDKEDNSYKDDIKEKRDRWIESLKKDIYVNEAINLLRDLSSIKSNEILSQINID